MRQKLAQEGIYGQSFTNAYAIARRNFVIYKYNLYSHLNEPSNYVSSETLRGPGRYSTNVVANAPCINEGFENGTLSGWATFTGNILFVSSQTYPSTPTSISAGPLATVVTTPFSDAYVGTIPLSPLGGTRIVRLNNNSANAKAVKMRQTFSVTPTNIFLILPIGL